MKQEIVARALTLYIGDQDQYKGGPLYAAVVLKLQEIGVAGVTVLHGIEGFGSHGKLHTQRIENLFERLPVVIEAIDSPDKIDIALKALDDMIAEGLVTLQDVRAIRYTRDG
jgi:PII-like signaling protein